MAALSGDENLMEDYRQPDAYIASAIRAGLAPSGATKKSHREIRALWKVVGGLAVPYGMQAMTLSETLGKTPTEADGLLRRHRDTYPTYWRWSEGAVRELFGNGELWTPYGWRFRAHSATRHTTGMNWPVQSAGAEMMRVAAALAVANGIPVCCPVHDAFLVEAPVEQIEGECHRMVEAMELASRKVLAGFTVRVPFDPDTDIVEFPNHYRDEKDDERQEGAGMWPRMLGLLEVVEASRRLTGEVVEG